MTDREHVAEKRLEDILRRHTPSTPRPNQVVDCIIELIDAKIEAALNDRSASDAHA